jgi:hypothetical protein
VLAHGGFKSSQVEACLFGNCFPDYPAGKGLQQLHAVVITWSPVIQLPGVSAMAVTQVRSPALETGSLF